MFCTIGFNQRLVEGWAPKKPKKLEKRGIILNLLVKMGVWGNYLTVLSKVQAFWNSVGPLWIQITLLLVFIFSRYWSKSIIRSPPQRSYEAYELKVSNIFGGIFTFNLPQVTIFYKNPIFGLIILYSEAIL